MVYIGNIAGLKPNLV